MKSLSVFFRFWCAACRQLAPLLLFWGSNSQRQAGTMRTVRPPASAEPSSLRVTTVAFSQAVSFMPSSKARQPVGDLLVEKPGLARPAHPNHYIHLAGQARKREAPARHLRQLPLLEVRDQGLDEGRAAILSFQDGQISPDLSFMEGQVRPGSRWIALSPASNAFSKCHRDLDLRAACLSMTAGSRSKTPCE